MPACYKRSSEYLPRGRGNLRLWPGAFSCHRDVNKWGGKKGDGAAVDAALVQGSQEGFTPAFVCPIKTSAVRENMTALIKRAEKKNADWRRAKGKEVELSL